MKLGVLLLGASLAGCAIEPPVMTASGQPEVTLSNIDATCVRGAFLNLFVNQGFSVKSTNDAQIVAGKERRDDLGFLYSTRFSGFPEDRITVLFIPMPNRGMRIVVNEAIVSNPGSGFERVNALSQGQSVQDTFTRGGEQIQAQCRA